ncbi:hypothetical protein ACFPN0_15250 [Kitasatospora cinereorecta]
MAVEPIPCDDGGSTPVEVTTCCSPSIASAPLCRADGSTVLAVVRSGCVECGQAADDPAVVGWLDAAGVFTPGALPADTGPCDAGCVDTVCRQLCDDTDGDGAADATYSELWCIRADGTAELVLTYQDDPSLPYTPVAPVDCTYGCPDSETVTLCDDSGPFLRRYSFLNGSASYEDVDLDGQTPHVVTGTVGVCDGEPCDAQTTPAATIGLCLADGTPIAVVVTRDCAGTVTQDGWLNLTTGAYAAGDPPAGTMACGNPRSISTTGTFCDVDPGTGDVLGLVLIEYTYGADGAVASVRLVDATTGTTYVPQGEVTTCPAGVEQPERDLVQLCDTASDGTVTAFVRDYARDENGAVVGHSDYDLDGAAYVPTGTVGRCAAAPCRDSSSTLLCDTAGLEAVTVLDPANRPGADGWEIVSYTGYGAGYGPESAIPYPVHHPVGNPNYMGVRSDLTVGPGPGYANYETAPVRWVMRKTFTAPEDGIAVVSSANFRGDGGARVRVNGQDAGMYGQWNQPATSGTAQIPVTAGTNTVEVEVRDGGGQNYIMGRLNIVMTRTVQFMRRTVVDCETGETVAVVDTTLDGEPYTVTGEVGQCEPVAECCEQPPPETRVDIETALLCVRDETTGEILGQVIAERVYDDQSGDLTEQRLTDLDGDAYTLPAGAELTKCPSPDRITRQVCVVESGSSEFLTNAANATSGQDSDWTWSPNVAGPWHPMYRVARNALWTAADSAPNPAHWVSPHSNRTVCPAAGETSPPVPGTWFTRASWNLPVDVSPDSIRIAATVLNADNKVVQWRLNDGAWQPVGGGTLAAPAWAFPPTAVPGGRAGQNDVVVQITETQPAVTCPSANEAGMILHVVATYDHAPQVWTQVIEPGGHTYYLDENGDRQDSIPAGRRLVACGGGGDAPCCPPEARVDVESDVMCIRTAEGEITGQVVVERIYDDQSGDCTEQRLTDPTTGDPVDLPAGAELVLCQEPDCPVAFSTECVGAVTRTEASYDNTSLIGGAPGQCGSVQGPGGQFPCQPTSGAFTITSWVVNGEEAIAEGGGRVFNGGPCGRGTGAAPGMHLNWAQALTNLDPTGATWTVKNEPACAFFVGSTGGTQTVYGPMTVQDAAGQQWILGPAQACEEVQYTKVYTQECDGTVSVSWLDAQGVATEAPEGDLVPCGTGCGAGGGRGLDVETLTLCDVQADGTAVPFLRHLTYGTSGAVSVVIDTGLDGFAPYTPTGTVTRCQDEHEPGVEVELTPMCVVDTTSGNVLQRVLAEVRYDTATGDRLGVNYVDPVTWGPVAIPGGAHLGMCPPDDVEPCRNTTTVLLCDAASETETITPAVASTTLAGLDLAESAAYPLLAGSWAALWSGGALAFPQDPNASAGDGAQVYRTIVGQITGTVPDDCATASGELTVSVRVRNDGPAPGAGGSGVMRLYRSGTMLTSTGPVTSTPVGHVQTLTSTTAVTAADLASGDLRFVLSLETFHSAPKSWTADQFTLSSELAGCEVQFLRNVTTDCQTGEVTSVTDTTLDGDPYTVTGEVGQCTTAGGACCPDEPCGDTEVTQLCDLTYDPQAPIATPAADFALTGNVVVGNAGTTLWFAQANQEANGTAELTVSGLLPAVMYQFRFASAWIGAGAPNPVANAAVYELEIFDGATVLASRTRNVSNGSAVFPGGTLTEDLPPLAFIAPATGAVTIRFTDQTTGGPINDRDLFLMPLDVRTAVLTLNSTPFLRRFTFDCDGGLTSTQDLALDGVTPYDVQGEVGSCTADGGTTAAVSPCDVQNVIQACRCDDTDGDGFADTDYVELIGVDCEGALTSLGTYTADLSAPYAPVAPIDCAETAEGAEPAIGVQARRVELAADETWDAADWTTLQSVTAIAHGGTGTVTTDDGSSTLHTGEAATWSVARDTDAALTGPLTIAAGTGTVTVTWTRGVTL